MPRSSTSTRLSPTGPSRATWPSSRGRSPLHDGLAILEGSHVPHYHGEAQRRPPFHRPVTEGSLPAGFGVDDGPALVYHGTDLHEAVGQVPDAGAFRVEAVDGEIREAALPVRELGS